MRKLGGARDFGVGRFRPAEADIVGDGGGKHHAVLRHERDARAQIRRIEIGEPHTVERYAPGGRDRSSATCR